MRRIDESASGPGLVHLWIRPNGKGCESWLAALLMPTLMSQSYMPASSASSASDKARL